MKAVFVLLACCALASVNLAKKAKSIIQDNEVIDREEAISESISESISKEEETLVERSTSGLRMCYWPAWAQWSLPPANIPANKCDYVIYSFAFVDAAGKTLKHMPSTPEAYAALNSAKAQKGFKTMLSVGGGTMPLADGIAMLGDATTRDTFAANALKYAKDRAFDGIDLDWEYPGCEWKSSSPTDASNYAKLIATMSAKAKTMGMKLSIATQSTAYNLGQAFGGGSLVPQICRDVDFVNVMSYDQWGAWGGVTTVGHHAPLDRSSQSMKTAADWLVGKGCIKSKMMLGVPFYGTDFTMASTTASPTAPFSSAGGAGKPKTHYTYPEACTNVKNGWKIHNDLPPAQKVRYMTYGDQWLGFDDPESIRAKMQFVLNNGYGGGLAWSINQDDMDGSACNGVSDAAMGNKGAWAMLNAFSSGLGH